MNRIPVDSSSLVSIGYDIVDGLLVLEVEFKGERLYHYYDVPAEVHYDLMKAESVGSYFNKNIAKKYKYRQIE
jgi:hypothetical protein